MNSAASVMAWASVLAVLVIGSDLVKNNFDWTHEMKMAVFLIIAIILLRITAASGNIGSDIAIGSLILAWLFFLITRGADLIKIASNLLTSLRS